MADEKPVEPIVRIKELGEKSTQLLLFLSFAMVSIATLESVGAHVSWQPKLDQAFRWWIVALIPALVGIVPVKELNKAPQILTSVGIKWSVPLSKWCEWVRWSKIIMQWITIGLIIAGIVPLLKLPN